MRGQEPTIWRTRQLGKACFVVVYAAIGVGLHPCYSLPSPLIPLRLQPWGSFGLKLWGSQFGLKPWSSKIAQSRSHLSTLGLYGPKCIIYVSYTWSIRESISLLSSPLGCGQRMEGILCMGICVSGPAQLWKILQFFREDGHRMIYGYRDRDNPDSGLLIFCC